MMVFNDNQRRRTPRFGSFVAATALWLVFGVVYQSTAWSQLEQLQTQIQEGTGVPSEVRTIYQRGIDYLVNAQSADGSWNSSANFHGDEASGIAGLAVMAFLSTGEDPNFGRYAKNVRSAIRFIIQRQSGSTGYYGGNMYVHGFAMLALAEAYGAVDDDLIWAGETDPSKRRTIGQSLELAVRLAVTSQEKNPSKGWRYSPNDNSADTSVVGAVLMGLLAARNAGFDVPDKTIDGALDYMKSMTSTSDGAVGYSGLGGLGGSDARTAIACLVFSIGKRTEWEERTATRQYLIDRLEGGGSGWAEYERYYKAQALFQADYESWQRWNQTTIQTLRNMQQADGQIGTSQHGPVYSTSMALLALALNYRFLPIYER
ncbi:prenyltransferase/squalene oxidase repeat-containing protein [Pirellulaceae bacterium SH449]